jgi:hypothetical protein
MRLPTRASKELATDEALTEARSVPLYVGIVIFDLRRQILGNRCSVCARNERLFRRYAVLRYNASSVKDLPITSPHGSDFGDHA